MADKTVALGASDLFDLVTISSNFHVQSSSTEPYSTEAVALTSGGDLACSSTHDAGNNYSASYKYCGSDLDTDAGALLTAFGAVRDSKLITGLDISFPGPGEQPELTVTGHDHGVNTHDSGTNPPNTFDVSAIVPDSIGTGVPALIANTNADAEQVSGSLSFAANHIDVESNSGHWVGESVTCRCDMTLDFVGVATLTAGDWLQILTASSDGNEEIDTSSVTAHQYIDAS